MTITEFLTARYDEDEVDRLEIHELGCPRTDQVAEAFDWKCTCGYPDRIVADIAAKRAIVALHSEGTMACYWSHDSMEMHEPGEVCDTLQALVQPYAEHPDFDPSWRTA